MHVDPEDMALCAADEIRPEARLVVHSATKCQALEHA